jgi:periplasmic mercuric ion binding protein
MKTKIIRIILSAVLTVGAAGVSQASLSERSSSIMHDDEKIDTFKVSGNCGMCKRTIEGSVANLKGVDSAVWNVETKIMTVVYHTHHVSLDEIKRKIASVGYDTAKYKANEESYKGLPGCCQYDR